MNKKFASFLLSGKVAALPLFVNQGLASVHITGSERSASGDKHGIIAPGSLTSGTTLLKGGAGIIVLDGSVEKGVPRIMNLVITGLHDKDEVLILLSPEKDTPKLLKGNTHLPLGSEDVSILSCFSASGSHYDTDGAASDRRLRSHVSEGYAMPVLVPVDLGAVKRPAREGQRLYVHVVVVQDSGQGKSLKRYSDVLEIRSIDKPVLISAYGDITEDCTPYTCY